MSVAPPPRVSLIRRHDFVPTARIRIALAGDDDVEAMAAFYRAIWTKDATAESVRASRQRSAAENVVAPGEPPPVVLAFEGDRVVGHWASIPQRLWDGVAEWPTYWMNGLMVFPEFRNGLTALLLVKELSSLLPRSTTLTVLPVARGLLSTVGYKELGVVPNFVRPLRAASLAQRLDLSELGLTQRPGWILPGVRGAQRTGLASLVGGAVGLAVSASSDVRWVPGRADAGLAWLGGVARATIAAASDAILCTTSNHALVRLLKRQAYIPLPGNLHFFLRDTTDAVRWSDLPAWWLARGDGGADAVF